MLKRGLMIAAGVLCLALAAYLVYVMVRPSKDYGPVLDPIQMTMAERAVPRAVGDMRGKLPPKFFHAVLLQFEGHRNAIDLRNMVEREVVDRKALGLKNFEDIAREKKQPDGWLDKAKSYASSVVASVVGGEALTADEKVEEAVAAAGMDGYVGGNLYILEGSDKEERLELTLYATDLKGRQVFRETYVEKISKSLFDLEYYRFKVGEIGMFWKIIMWAVFTVVLPVVTYFLPAKAIKADSNKAVLGALAAYTVLDVFFALALMGFSMPGVIAFVTLLLAVGLSAFYNWAIFTEIKDMV